MHAINVNNYEIIVDNNNSVARFKDFTSPISQDAGYCFQNVEDGCALLLDLKDKQGIAICLNKRLASKVVECQEDLEKRIVCCLTTDYKNLDFLCKNGKQFITLFRISLIEPMNELGISLEDLLSNDGGSSFREMTLAYVLKDAKNSDDSKHLYTGHPFRQSLKTDIVGDIQSY